jgi:hypothetical protein
MKAQRRLDAGDDGDSCNPRLCALGRLPHAHCVCGLPMNPGAVRCDLCVEEGLVSGRGAQRSQAEWDGISYPSRRVRQPVGIPAGRYEGFLRAVLGPATARAVQRAEEAA